MSKKKLKFRNTRTIEVNDWDDLVSTTYGRPYSFQQQDGCKSRGTYELTIPSKYVEDYKETSIPEIVNGKEMGVSFEAWKTRDPKEWTGKDNADYVLDLWWTRNFYPSVEVVANDLYERGLIEAGDYVINIDW